MNDFTQLVDLAAEQLGGRVVAANDEFFAPKENLLKPAKPVFLEGKYTTRGKWMDGWETRRRRSPGYDWCIVRLGLAGIVRGVVVDTSHFKGNYPEHCSLEVCAAEGSPGVQQLTDSKTKWVEVLPKSQLRGDTQNRFPVSNPQRFTHLRFKIYPDGGVARLRIYGEVVPDAKRLNARRGELDLAAVEIGGRIVASSDQFFSAPQNLLLPGRAKFMGDGWETRRRRGPGFDWVVIQLGVAGTIHYIEVDTTHFKGNFPESCSLEACHSSSSAAEDLRTANLPWRQILARTPLRADARHRFKKELQPSGSVTHVRFNIFPDGGVSRLRVFGAPERGGSGAKGPADGLRRLNAFSARAALLDCCGSTKWAEQMSAARPFESIAQLLTTADGIWAGLSRRDWLEAFSRHPQIGEKKAARKQTRQAQRWSAGEQSAASRAAAGTRGAFTEANRAYRACFGYIFIVCAAGKSSEEILATLKQRLANDAETEIRVAGEEQRRITRFRLEKLLEP